MKALLKRRWILLSSVVVLLACSVISLEKSGYGFFPMANGCSSLAVEGAGLREGEFFLQQDDHFPEMGEKSTWSAPRIHPPRFGNYPSWQSGRGHVAFAIPLWVPLSTVLGWLVLRELRWREKRAKATQAT